MTLIENAAATTARMPEACTSSAVRNAVNGTSSTSDVSSVGLRSRLRIHSASTANTAPMAEPDHRVAQQFQGAAAARWCARR